jgi:hypothetical protein
VIEHFDIVLGRGKTWKFATGQLCTDDDMKIQLNELTYVGPVESGEDAVYLKLFKNGAPWRDSITVREEGIKVPYQITGTDSKDPSMVVVCPAPTIRP